MMPDTDDAENRRAALAAAARLHQGGGENTPGVFVIEDAQKFLDWLTPDPISMPASEPVEPESSWW